MAEKEHARTSRLSRDPPSDLEKLDTRKTSSSDHNNHGSSRSSEGSERSEIDRIETAREGKEENPNITTTVSSGSPPHSIFSLTQKRYIAFMVSWAGFFSPLSGNIYFPALNTLAKDLNVSNELINLTLTSYLIFQGLSPTVFGDFADMAGRRPAYLIAFTIYIGANIGLALQDSYAALFILRCLQSSGSSGTVALGNGVIADITTSSERGTWMGAALMGPMVGPAIGPVLGGVLSTTLGWRAIFWFLTIMAVVYLVLFAITVPETGRNVVGNGSVPPQGWNMSILNYIQLRKLRKSEDSLSRINSQREKRNAQSAMAETRRLRFPNPLNTIYIILEKDVGIILFFNSLVLAAFYDITATIPSLFQGLYRYNDLQIGLCYMYVTSSYSSQDDSLQLSIVSHQISIKVLRLTFIQTPWYSLHNSCLCQRPNPGLELQKSSQIHWLHH
jgi:multidrug resistance protein